MGVHCSKTERKTQDSRETETSTPKSQDEPASKPLRITINNSQKNIRAKELDEDKRKKVQTEINFSSKEDIRDLYQFNPNVIGSGFYGTVRKASPYLLPNKVFAVKSIQLEKLKSKSEVDLIENEIKIMKTLNHPGMIKFFETYHDHKFIHIVSEYLSGGDLLDHLANLPSKKMNERDAAKIMKELLSVISFLHKNGLAHRDIKPENILFTSPQKTHVKIIDFGLSKFFDKKSQNALHSIVGTRYYMAPEIIEDKGYNHLCDNWSVGTILYLILSGTPPFFSEQKAQLFELIKKAEVNFENQVWSTISDEAKDLIKKLITKEPTERISLDEALDHAWIKKYAQETLNEDELNRIDNIKDKIYKSFKNLLNNQEYNDRKYNGKLKSIFFNLCLNLLENEILSDLNLIYDFFASGKEKITLSDLEDGVRKLEFSDFFSKEELEKLIQTMNIQNSFDLKEDDDVSINYNTFLLSLLVSEPDYNHFENSHLTKIFEYMDFLQKGYISKQDVKIIFKRKGFELDDDEVNEILKYNKNLEYKDVQGFYNYEHSPKELSFSWEKYNSLDTGCGESEGHSSPIK